MSEKEKGMEIVHAVFNNEKIINEVLESLKKELLEVIFMENLSTFKKALFIQGAFAYANLILNANQTLADEEKEKRMIELINISRMLGEEALGDISKYIN